MGRVGWDWGFSIASYWDPMASDFDANRTSGHAKRCTSTLPNMRENAESIAQTAIEYNGTKKCTPGDGVLGLDFFRQKVTRRGQKLLPV
jgi:hypothetical protein